MDDSCSVGYAVTRTSPPPRPWLQRALLLTFVAVLLLIAKDWRRAAPRLRRNSGSRLTSDAIKAMQAVSRSHLNQVGESLIAEELAAFLRAQPGQR